MVNNIRKLKMNVFEMIFINLLFLFCLNFMNKSNYIYIGLMLVFIVWMYIKNIKISLTVEFLILTICFTTYFLIYQIYFSISIHSFITFWIGPILGYFIGYHIVNMKGNLDISIVSFTIVWGMFIHGMLNIILFLVRGVKGRLIPDIWLGTDILATLQGTFFTLICSLFFYSLYHVKSKFTKIIFLAAMLFSIFSTLQTASRTLLLITGVVFVVNMIIYIYLNTTKFNKILKTTIKILLVVCVIIICYKSNFLKMKEIYEESELYKRINSEYQTNLDEDPRFDMYKTVAREMFNYPMGGNKMPFIGYAHNLWLDTAKTVGIIPFFLLVLYTIMTLLTLIKFIKNKYIQDDKKYLMASLYIGMILNFMVEPILEGVPYMFIMMCIINGTTRYTLDSSKRRLQDENIMVM